MPGACPPKAHAGIFLLFLLLLLFDSFCFFGATFREKFIVDPTFSFFRTNPLIISTGKVAFLSFCLVDDDEFSSGYDDEDEDDDDPGEQH